MKIENSNDIYTIIRELFGVDCIALITNTFLWLYRVVIKSVDCWVERTLGNSD